MEGQTIELCPKATSDNVCESFVQSVWFESFWYAYCTSRYKTGVSLLQCNIKITIPYVFSIFYFSLGYNVYATDWSFGGRHGVPLGATEADETKKPVPRQSAVLKANKRRKTASDVFAKFDKVFESFVEYQQAADKSFREAEAARERREEERAEKWRKEDQEFLLKLAQVLHK